MHNVEPHPLSLYPLCMHVSTIMFDKQILMNIKPFDYYYFDGCVHYIKRPVVTMSSVSNSALGIAGRVGLRLETLDTPVTESAFLSLAIFVDPWRLVFHDLLAPTDISDVDAENRSEQEKRVACLRKWKSRNGAEATYRVIVQSVVNCGHVDKAEAICKQVLLACDNKHSEGWCTTWLS